MKHLILLLALAPVCNAAERTLLFVDDHDILYRAGTTRVLEKPARHARNPLITEDKPWEMSIAWTSVHRDKATGRYQMWYQAYAGKRAQLKTHECVVCYAESAKLELSDILRVKAAHEHDNVRLIFD